ncbi:hypothetical protein H4R21_003421 [Coemansia helicoidea]|uniref:Uncharacterized protein n=1 Tax=Coemansia helicoidea TaxID=1286919 RepID=A0ACC1L2Z4_9FUNG|nr:hypothetical protein H4R21_003421 [Coemansia helicoidea]
MAVSLATAVSNCNQVAGSSSQAAANDDEEESLPSTLFDNLPSFLGITFPGDFNPTATGSNTGPTTTGTRTTSTRTSTRPTSDTKTDTSGGAHPWRQQLVPAVAIALLAAL